VLGPCTFIRLVFSASWSASCSQSSDILVVGEVVASVGVLSQFWFERTPVKRVYGERTFAVVMAMVVLAVCLESV